MTRVAVLYALAAIMLVTAWLLPTTQTQATFYIANAILYVVVANGLESRRNRQP